MFNPPAAKNRKQSGIRFLLVLSFILLALIAGPGSRAKRALSPQSRKISRQAQGERKRTRPAFVPGDVLLRFKKDRAFEGAAFLAVPDDSAAAQGRNQTSQSASIAVPQEQILAQVDRFEGSDLIDGLRIARVAPQDTAKAIAALKARDDVLYAEPNYIRRVSLTPNDASYNQLWALKNFGQTVNGVVGTAGDDIHAEQAWNITTGSSSTVVGVIDEGIDINHPDLHANIWTNPSPGSISGISGDVHGYDFINNTGSITPEFHATHVAGTIGAVGNNGLGVAGVNWQVSLMSLRFINDATGSGSEANAIRAYAYAKQMRDLWVSSGGTKGANLRVLNASYGGGGFTQAESDALNALGQSGVLFVAAAGNESTNSDITPNYPSGYALPNVIAVAATNSNDQLAGFSNYGPHSVLMGAPGVNIFSTLPGNNYGFLSGTSMATPHVTGSAALLCAANPNLTINQLRALLAFNGDVSTWLQGTTLTGRRLNVFNSLQALAENDTTPPGMVGNFRVNAQNGRTFTLSWIASGDDGAAGRASLYDISFTDQSSGEVTGLTTVAPDASGSPQFVTVTVPNRHTVGTIKLREFDNVGNEGLPASIAVSIDPLIADPYVSSLSSPASLSTGGTPLGLTLDDRYLENFSLPFNFPFFGQSYNTVTISTNGNLYFSPPPKRSNGDADDVPSSIDGLAQFKMIAGMWDDLDLRTSSRADADVYVVPNSSTIIFRWQGVPCNDFGNGCTGGDPINFEIELRADGTIITRYGAGNTNLLPVVGISGGEPDPYVPYVIDALTSELSPKTLTNAQSAVFTPRTATSTAMQFSAANYSVGEGDGHVTITVTRTGDTSGSASVDYKTVDDPLAVRCDDQVNNHGAAYARCDYATTVGTLTFAPSETLKSFTIPIIDDGFVEGPETFQVALSNPSPGVALNTPAMATITIIDNDTASTPNPIFTTPFFVRQHYLDFLSREPEPGEPWSAVLNNCSDVNNNPACDRLAVSAAFFGSPEFQLKGYFVYRFYKLGFNRQSDYSEIIPDMSSVTGQTPAEVFAKKAAFTNLFVQRAEFTNAYGPLTNAQYVAALMGRYSLNSITTPDPAQPDGLQKVTLTTADLTNQLNAAMLTRAQILRAIADSDQVFNLEFNQAFVAMQYYGYLRRTPEQAGYNAWLNYLNANPTDSRTMVNGFVNSIEYRLRFGN
jgi:subtilisin family serine protease